MVVVTFRLNWSPQDEELDKIKENFKILKLIFFFTLNCCFWPKIFIFKTFRMIWWVICWTSSSLNCLWTCFFRLSKYRNKMDESDIIKYYRLICYFDFIHRSNWARYKPGFYFVYSARQFTYYNEQHVP